MRSTKLLSFVMLIISIFSLFLPWISIYIGDQLLTSINFIQLCMRARTFCITLIFMIFSIVVFIHGIRQEKFMEIAIASVIGIFAMISFMTTLLVLAAKMFPPTVVIAIDVGPVLYMFMIFLIDVLAVADLAVS